MHRNSHSRSLVARTTMLVAALALIVGCSTTVSDDRGAARSDSVVDDMSADSSSGELIEAALAADEIDKPTSLLYHTWAQFGDPSLPEKFQGAPAPHDLGVLAEAQDSLDDLPGDISSKIAPYFKRPSDPESAFSIADDESTGTSTRGRAVAGAEQPQRCGSEWVSEVVPDLPLRVWACPDMGEERTAEVLEVYIEMLSDFAPGMFADLPDGLGPPIPDDPSTQDHPDADDRIDIYTLPEGWMAPYRELNERSLGPSEHGATMQASPKTATSSSAYIVFGSYLVDNPDYLRFSLAHDLFHVQQFGHFAHTAGLNGNSNWFYEASAQWAASHFLDDRELPLRQIAALQRSPLPIHVDGRGDDYAHGYWAYFWPLFIEQELGPEAVFQVWDDMDSVPVGEPGGTAMAAVGLQMDVAEAFPEFVMRLFNANLPGNPISPRFNDVLSYLRDGLMPNLAPVVLADDPVHIDQEGIPGLGYRYSEVATNGSQQDPVQVTMSTDLATPSGADVSVEALVPGTDGDYTREVISSDGNEFCVSDDVYLVAANTSVVIDDETTGSVEVARGGDADCTTTPASTTAPPSSTTPAAACDEVATWDTTRKATDISLNAPIVSVTGETGPCYDIIIIGLDSTAADPGYVVEYVENVTQPGSGNVVPVAGSHALQVVLDSPTTDRTSPDFTPTVQTSDNMVDVTGFGAVRQVAHAGSFEGMTTFGIGVDGEQPFTVEAGENALIIKVARAN